MESVRLFSVSTITLCLLNFSELFVVTWCYLIVVHHLQEESCIFNYLNRTRNKINTQLTLILLI